MSKIGKRYIDPERAEHRRTQVLDAAAVCFARSGFHGASMAEISKQAGMSAGHIYNYFDSKDAIIMAFVKMRVEHINDRLLNVSKQDDPLEYMYDEMVEIVEQQLDASIWGMSLEIYAEASRNPLIASALRAADMSARSKLRALVKAGRARRQLTADDHTVEGRTTAMISLFNGLPLNILHDPNLNRTDLVNGCRVAMRALMMT